MSVRSNLLLCYVEMSRNKFKNILLLIMSITTKYMVEYYLQHMKALYRHYTIILVSFVKRGCSV